jgi:glutamyl-tRNA synthetase
MSMRELIDAFSLEGISGGNAVFNTEKLDWMNAQYIARLPIEELARAVEPFLAEAGLWANADPRGSAPRATDEARFYRLLELLRPRAKRLTDFVEQARPFLVETVDYEPEAIEKHLGAPDLASHIAALASALRRTNPFDEPHVEAAVRGTAAERGIKVGPLIHATRVAMTGRTTSPGLFEVLALLGKDRAIARLDQLLNFLATRV